MVDSVSADAFRHIALIYAAPADYLLGIRAFIAAGRSGGEPTLVAVPRGSGELLRLEFGGDSPQLTFADMTELGRNPARIIPEILGFARKHPRKRTRCITEPAWPGRSAAELRETVRHETLANLALRDIAATVLCPYNKTELAPAVLADAASTHPAIIGDGQERASTRYFGGTSNQLSGERERMPAPPARAEALGYTSDLRAVRRFVAVVSRRAGLPEERITDLVVSVSELAANTLRHTDHGGTVTIWHTKVHMICQVRDSGLISDPLAGHRLPPADMAGGQGLWLVNQLCDLVQRRSSLAGTVTRLHMHLRLHPS